MKKNIKKYVGGLCCQFAGAGLATLAMYFCSFHFQISGLYDEDMAKTLYLPVIMMLPALVLYGIWFWRRVKKFTGITYINYDSKHYNRPSRFFLALCLHYVAGILAMIPFFLKDYMANTVSMLPSLGICEVFLLIADYCCFWVEKIQPKANDKN